MFPVIYLTGAPASGKSTLAKNLRARHTNLTVFAYSEELRRMIEARSKSSMQEDDIRRLSAAVVTAKDVEQLDSELIARVGRERSGNPFLIDSHPVTKENFGFRVTGFSFEQLKALNPDAIICLYTPTEIALQRIATSPMGRPIVSEFEAAMHTQLQCSTAIQYGVVLGRPAYLVDSSVSEDDLVDTVSRMAQL